tara:strand:+ start:463 stop:732 length:270 start_codon:yes stop_codon:yes gene_type:complete
MDYMSKIPVNKYGFPIDNRLNEQADYVRFLEIRLNAMQRLLCQDTPVDVVDEEIEDMTTLLEQVMQTFHIGLQGIKEKHIRFVLEERLQ